MFFKGHGDERSLSAADHVNPRVFEPVAAGQRKMILDETQQQVAAASDCDMTDALLQREPRRRQVWL